MRRTRSGLLGPQEDAKECDIFRVQGVKLKQARGIAGSTFMQQIWSFRKVCFDKDGYSGDTKKPSPSTGQYQRATSRPLKSDMWT